MGQRILRDTEATIQGPVARVKQLGVISRAGAGRVIVFVMIKEICSLDGFLRSTWFDGPFYLEPRQKFLPHRVDDQAAGPEYWNFYVRGSEPS